MAFILLELYAFEDRQAFATLSFDAGDLNYAPFDVLLALFRIRICWFTHNQDAMQSIVISDFS